MKHFEYKEPTCILCDAHNNIHGNRYCNGGKRSRYFKSSDPKIKVPKWCPKRNAPPVVRVYDFKSDNAKAMHVFFTDMSNCISPSGYHYKLVFETKGFTNAKDFYERTKRELIAELIGFDVGLHSVVEIDDGLKPHYFYYHGFMTFTSVYFNPPKVSDANVKKQKKQRD